VATKQDPLYYKTLEVSRNRLNRLAADRNVSQLKGLYDTAQDELHAKLQRTTPGRKEDFTAHQQRIVLAQVRQGQAVLSRRMAGEQGDLTRQAQVDSLRGLGSMIGKLEQKFTGADVPLPIDEAARFWGVVDKRRTSLLQQHKTSMASYGKRVVGAVEQNLALSLVQQETTEEAIDRVRKVAGNEWWQAERIVRTETAWAMNATHADGIAEIAEEVDDMYMRWTEHVTDDGEPMDNRVGADSIAMHGQVTRPGGLFTMPDEEGVSDSLVGMRWAFPPNRPNDRAVLSPWRPDWGGLAWTFNGRRRRYL
jgi:hypothetical protein